MESSFSVQKLAENLAVLNQNAKNIISALYNMKYLIQSDQFGHIDSAFNDGTDKTQVPKAQCPRVLGGDQQLSVISKLFIKKYPEHPSNELSKLPIYPLFATEAKNITEELRVHYNTIHDALGFIGSSQTVLLSCERLSSSLNCGLGFDLLTEIFSLLVNYFSVFQLLSDLGDAKKALISIYCYLTPSETSSIDYQVSRYNRLVDFFAQTEKYLPLIQETLAPVAPFFVNSVAALSADFNVYGNLGADSLRKDSQLNCFTDTNLKVHSSDDLKFRMIPFFNNFATIVPLVVLCFPQECLKRFEVIDQLKTVLASNVYFPLFRAELFNVLSDFETACKSNSKLSKLKSVVNDNYATLLQKSVIFHRERRDYLRHALGQFLHLATDRPFILEYKAPVVECLLAMAKEEVMWYLAHCEALFASRMPKQHQSRIQSATGGAVDQRITELLYLAFHVRQLVVSQKRLISSSYSRLLKTHYGPLLSASVARIISATRKLDEPIAALLNTIVKQIEDCRPIGDSSTTTAVDMGVFRMNYLRLLVYCHSTFNTITDESGQEDLLALMNEIQIRSRYATEPSIQQTFEQGQGCCGCNFSQLYYCRPILQQMYESVVRQQPEQMRFISVYAKLAAQDFSLNASSYFPVERERITEKTLAFVDEFLVVVTESVAQYLLNIGLYNAQMSRQLIDSKAVMFVPERREKKKKQETKSKPGAESEFSNIGSLEPLPLLFVALQNGMIGLLSAGGGVGGEHSFAITLSGSAVFYPKEYLKDALRMKLKGFFSRGPTADESITSPKEAIIDDIAPSLKRPSVFLNEIEAVLEIVASFDEKLDCGLVQVFESLIYEELDLLSLKKITELSEEQQQQQKTKTIARGKRGATQPPAAAVDSFMLTYSSFYSAYFAGKGSAATAIVSDLRRSILSLGLGSARYYNVFTDPLELQALCRLIGPVGVKSLELAILDSVQLNWKQIKETIATSADAFQSLYRGWTSGSDAKSDELIKKSTKLYEIAANLIDVGFILKFSNRLQEALLSTLYCSSRGLLQELVDLHSIESPESARLLSIAEVSKPKLDTIFQLDDAWKGNNSLLSICLCLTAYSVAIDDRTVYDSGLDAFENNAQCFVTGTCALLSCLPGGGADVKREFLFLSSTMILRGAKSNQRAGLLILENIARVIGGGSELAYTAVPYSVLKDSFEFYRKTSLVRNIVEPKTEEAENS